MVNHFATAPFFALEKQASPGKVEYACFSISEWEAISLLPWEREITFIN